MGTYRTLRHDGLPCPFCGSAITDGIQFKYGWCECDDVRIGDAISWFYDLRSCYGRPVGGRVQVDGALDVCPHCKQQPEALVTIHDDRIVAVELVTVLPDLGPERVLELGGQRQIELRHATKGKNGHVECLHCRWKSNTCTDGGHPELVYCERCGGGISRESWLELRV